MAEAITVGFKISSDLVARADAAAKAEGLSRADILRRAFLRDLKTAAEQPRENAA